MPTSPHPHAVNLAYFADIRFPLERANGIQTMETCWALADRGVRVHLVVRADTHVPARDPFEYYGRPRLDRLIIERAPIPNVGVPGAARRLGYLAFAAGRAIGAGRPDLVMTRDLAVASLLLRLPQRPPLVYESHGYAPDVAAALPELLSTAVPASQGKLTRLARREAYVWAHADGYVTITQGLADELAQRFGARQRLAIVPDGARLEPAPAAPRDADPDAPLVVGYAGHLYAWKGVDTVLQALAKIDGARGLIVGGHEQESDLARLRALAGSLGIQDRVTFTGQLRPGDVAARLAQADILVLPNPASAISTRATSPLKLFEYMAARRAIVASDLPSMREVLTDRREALLVAPGDAGALAAALRTLAADRALRERLAAAAFAAAAEYSWNRRAQRLEALFDEVLRARGSRTP